MFTAIVLVCNMLYANQCFVQTSMLLFADEQSCKADIQSAITNQKFRTHIAGEIYDVKQYRCINWSERAI
jgi:hypothetical protein